MWKIALTIKFFFACDGLERELSTEKKGYNTLNKALEKLDEYLGIQAAAGMSKAQCDLKNTKKSCGAGRTCFGKYVLQRIW